MSLRNYPQTIRRSQMMRMKMTTKVVESVSKPNVKKGQLYDFQTLPEKGGTFQIH